VEKRGATRKGGPVTNTVGVTKRSVGRFAQSNFGKKKNFRVKVQKIAHTKDGQSLRFSTGKLTTHGKKKGGGQIMSVKERGPRLQQGGKSKARGKREKFPRKTSSLLEEPELGTRSKKLEEDRIEREKPKKECI